MRPFTVYCNVQNVQYICKCKSVVYLSPTHSTHVHTYAYSCFSMCIFLYTSSLFFPLTSLLSLFCSSHTCFPPTPSHPHTPFRYLIGVSFCVLSGLLLLVLAVCLVLGCVTYERIPQTRDQKAQHMKRCFRLWDCIAHPHTCKDTHVHRHTCIHTVHTHVRKPWWG